MSNNMNFAKVFNCFTEPINETEQQYKLTPQELYLYAVLSIRKTRVHDVPSVLTSVDLLSQMVIIQKKQSANKKAIRVGLESLKSKGVINFDASAANSDLLEVMLTDNKALIGFEPVYGDLFTLAETPEQFMVLCVVQRWMSVSGVCTTGFERWMEILECGRGKVNDLLERMQTMGKILVSSGKNRRSYNRYWVGNGVPVDVAVDDIDANDDIAAIDSIDAINAVEVGVDAQDDPAEIDAVEAVSDVEAFSEANDAVPAIEDVEPSTVVLFDPDLVEPVQYDTTASGSLVDLIFDVPFDYGRDVLPIIHELVPTHELHEQDEIDEVEAQYAESKTDETDEFVPIEYAEEMDDPFDPFQQYEHSSSKAISEGVRIARHLAEQQPSAANDVLYGGQFTDEFIRLPRAVLTDVHVYAEHFKVNPSEDIYVQVDRLRRGYEWGGLELYLEVMERVAT